MRATRVGAALLTLSLAAPARGATFDAATGKVVLAGGAARGLSFDDPDGLLAAGARLASLRSDGSFSVERAPATASALDALLERGEGVALEGSGALRVGASAVLLFDAAALAPLANARFEVTLWARAEGAAPALAVLYGRTDEAAAGTRPFATVRGIPTGRETSDGWVEFTTGPLDGSVFGIGARAVALFPRRAGTAASFLVDALELRKLDGAITPSAACTQDDVDTTCGAGTDCLYGRCVPSSVTWGALPAPAHREELAAIWTHLVTQVQGDRAAVARGTRFGAEASRLAREASTSRQLLGGLGRLVNELRNKHTTFGVPARVTAFAPRPYARDLGLGCFGLVEADVLGGGLAYAVFRATPGGPLRDGDVLTSIDGLSPKVWVERHYPALAYSLGNDPRSDAGYSATALAELLVTRARTIELARCASATECDGPNRAAVRVEVGDAAYRGLMDGSLAASFSCTPRLRDAVASPRGRLADGTDAVDREVAPSGEVSVQFDGFSGTTEWVEAMKAVFDARPERVLMDARVGNGGQFATVKSLLALLRGSADGAGFVSIGRGGRDDIDPPRLFELGRPCATANDTMACYALSFESAFTAASQVPPGASTKIAWLNTNDVSANDYMPRLLKGRARLRVFAPHATAGAFGLLVTLPALLPGYRTATIQVQDTRFGVDYAQAAGAQWESGRGVEPDEVVVQTLSDLLRGEDTLLRVARAWLEAP